MTAAETRDAEATGALSPPAPRLVLPEGLVERWSAQARAGSFADTAVLELLERLRARRLATA